MAKGDRYWAKEEDRLARMSALRKAESDGELADGETVRNELVRKLHAGEMTLDEVQAELKRIKRNAKASGQKTRADFF